MLQVRRLAASLRPPSSKGPTAGTGSSGGMSARETTVIDVCQQLVATLRAQPEHKAVFVGEDGIAALMELLEERTPKVAGCPFTLPWSGEQFLTWCISSGVVCIVSWLGNMLGSVPGCRLCREISQVNVYIADGHWGCPLCEMMEQSGFHLLWVNRASSVPVRVHEKSVPVGKAHSYDT